MVLESNLLRAWNLQSNREWFAKNTPLKWITLILIRFNSGVLWSAAQSDNFVEGRMPSSVQAVARRPEFVWHAPRTSASGAPLDGACLHFLAVRPGWFI